MMAMTHAGPTIGFLVFFLIMALFKDLFSSSRNRKDSLPDPIAESLSRSIGPETRPVPMNLEERMAFRRELLYESIQATLSSRLIAVKTYRYKVMRTDKRGHCYVVMLDMSPDFMASPAGQHAQLTELGNLLVINAQAKFGLILGGVYWRLDETLAATVAGWAQPQTSQPAALDLNSPNLEKIHAENIEKYGQVTADEMADFEAAWQKNNVIQVGDRTYSSNMAPLMEEPPRS